MSAWIPSDFPWGASAEPDPEDSPRTGCRSRLREHPRREPPRGHRSHPRTTPAGDWGAQPGALAFSPPARGGRRTDPRPRGQANFSCNSLLRNEMRRTTSHKRSTGGQPGFGRVPTSGKKRQSASRALNGPGSPRRKSAARERLTGGGGSEKAARRRPSPPVLHRFDQSDQPATLDRVRALLHPSDVGQFVEHAV